MFKLSKGEKSTAATVELSVDATCDKIREIINTGHKAAADTTFFDSVLDLAKSGDRESKEKVLAEIIEIIHREKFEVSGYTPEALAERTYRSSWGLGILEDYYYRDDVVEIRVNRTDQVVIKYGGGKREILPPDKCFESEAEAGRVVNNLSFGDTGEVLDHSTGTIESVRKDGSRLAGTCYPVTRTWTANIRKCTAFVATKENYIKYGTMDERVWNLFCLFNRARVNTLYTGNVESGKTTLLRAGVGHMNKLLHILSLGRDMEIRLQDMYPDMDIWEAEAHPEIPGVNNEGVTMEKLLHLALRQGGDVLIMEEFRSGAEAIETLNAMTRGMYGSGSTAHFSGAKKAVEGIVRLLHRDGVNLPGNEARVWIAEAFHTIVHLDSDSITGRKLLVGWTELVTDGENVEYRDIVRWKPKSHHFFGEGEWIVSQPSDKLLFHMLRTVEPQEICDVGWTIPQMNS